MIIFQTSITSEPLIVEISMTTHFLAKKMNLTYKG